MPSKNIFFTNLDELKQGLSSDKKGQDVNLEFFDNAAATPEQESQWFVEDYEGQLSVDVYQTDEEIVVKATIAGVAPADLQIFLNDDLLTIRGRRHQDAESVDANYLYKECFWGGFSRSIILPQDVNPQAIRASLRNGVLTIHLPKIERSKTVSIEIDGE
jgi:HSP20 family protein